MMNLNPTMTTTRSTIPVPSDLRHLVGDEPPEMIGTFEAGRLLEHWGFSRDGKAAVRKLVKCNVLAKIELKTFTGWRFKTSDVMALHGKETA